MIHDNDWDEMSMEYLCSSMVNVLIEYKAIYKML